MNELFFAFDSLILSFVSEKFEITENQEDFVLREHAFHGIEYSTLDGFPIAGYYRNSA